MANRRVLVKRRKAVRNIRKITRTMQLIATARFRAAMTRATATRPYSEKLAAMVGQLASSASGELQHPLMASRGSAKRSALVAITSMRGLCGGYNGNVLRTSLAHLNKQHEAGIESDVIMTGKKGISYFRFLRRKMLGEITDIGDVPQFERIEAIANDLIARFTRGEIDSAYVSFMQLISVGRQQPAVIQLLPLAHEPVEDDLPEQAHVEFEFLPTPKDLLDELLPATVRVRLFQCFVEAIVSEHIARMVAMKSATDAAGDMIGSLTQQYNRARQTSITMELLDIVGGANALS